MAMEALRIAAKESKFLKFILGGFIFLAVGGLVFTDVGGYFTGGARGTTVAEVGDTKIDIRQFDSELRGFLQQTGLDAEDAYQAGLVNAFLQGKIANILRLQSAQELDLVLDNETIASEIKKTFQGASKDQILSTLRAQGLSEQQLAESIQVQTLNRYISAMPLAVANYVPASIQSANSKIKSEQRSGRLYTIPLNNLADDTEIDAEEINDYYQSNQAQFTIAEERVFTIGKMTLDMAKGDLQEPDMDDIRADYDSRPNDFTVPETRVIEQVIINDADKAQAIYEAVLNGTNLKQATIDISGDAAAFRAASDYQEDGLPDDIADVVFDSDLKVGDVTPPVKTLIGYTVTVLNDIKVETMKSFEVCSIRVKDGIATGGHSRCSL